MTNVTILFGTESGNSEMVADDLAVALHDMGMESQVIDMDQYDLGALADETMVVVVTSTYGEGELPQSAIAFHDALQRLKPALSSLRFAAFGLGDSTYATYNRGVATLVGTLTELNATQVGEIGYHDANSGLDASEVAADWLTTVFAAATT